MVTTTMTAAHLKRNGTMEPGRRPPAPGTLRLLQQFINTYNIEREHLGLRTEEFASPADLRRWLVSHDLLARNARVGAADVRRALGVREALRRLALAHNGSPMDSAAAEVLNRLARDARLEVRLRPDGQMRLEPRAPGVVGALGRLVAAAFTAQMEGTWARLKSCRRCHWAFYDHSKNRSGRWCVMSICGNRMKARSYRSRHRPR
jgi:predicted RNA-binding Zn ribbon-like protein